MRTIRQWRGEFGTTPPFDIGPDTLFVAYSAWAEMTCFMMLGWKFPVHIFDQHTAYLAASNILLPYNPDEMRKKPRKRLSDACRAYGIAGWERIDKEAIAKDIGEGRWREYGQEAVFDYCEEDVRASAQLLRRAIARHAPDCRRPTSSACCIGRTTAPRRSRKSRRAACRSTCRCGIWCRRTRPPSSASCCGSLTRATAATIRSTRRTASGATRDSSIGWSAPACRRGRGSTAASSRSTATPSG